MLIREYILCSKPLESVIWSFLKVAESKRVENKAYEKFKPNFTRLSCHGIDFRINLFEFRSIIFIADFVDVGCRISSRQQSIVKVVDNITLPSTGKWILVAQFDRRWTVWREVQFCDDLWLFLQRISQTCKS
jgi:hypothetical protein